MITILNVNRYNKEIKEVRLLSTDTKPTNVPNGSECIEMDTGKIYMFSEDNNAWYEM